jgi:hypothetical protein
MALKFEDVLSGEGMGAGKEEGQALIQGRARLIPEPSQGGLTRLGYAAEDGFGDQAYPGSRDPNHADAAKSGRRGDGGDGFGRHGSGL